MGSSKPMVRLFTMLAVSALVSCAAPQTPDTAPMSQSPQTKSAPPAPEAPLDAVLEEAHRGQR